MRQIITTTTREYDAEGRVVKETTVVSEPWPDATWQPHNPQPYIPQYPWWNYPLVTHTTPSQLYGTGLRVVGDDPEPPQRAGVLA